MRYTGSMIKFHVNRPILYLLKPLETVNTNLYHKLSRLKEVSGHSNMRYVRERCSPLVPRGRYAAAARSARSARACKTAHRALKPVGENWAKALKCNKVSGGEMRFHSFSVGADI